jgi:lipoprotein LprG
MAPALVRRAPRVVVALALASLLATLAGCSSGGDDTASEDVTVEVVLARAAEAMAAVRTAEFTIEQTGAEVFIDDAEVVRFVGATGRFAAPASADALVEVEAMGLSTEVGAVAVDGEIWMTNPLTGAWEEAPEGFSFDPSVLFDPEAGWSELLAEGMGAASLVPDDEEDTHHLRSTVGAERVAALTGGLVDEASTVDVWVGADDFRVVAATFDVGTAEGPSQWRLDVVDYDGDVTVTRP